MKGEEKQKNGVEMGWKEEERGRGKEEMLEKREG